MLDAVRNGALESGAFHVGSEMKNPFAFLRLAALVTALVIAGQATAADAPMTAGYDGLVKLFEEWRAFEHPPMKDGAPDYTAATTARRLKELASWRDRLEAIDTSTMPVEARVDQALIRAEMNGFDFYARVLQPWARDPAYYTSVWTDQSDTPAHEGTTHHDIVELWTYEFPLSRDAESKLARELAIVPPAARPGARQPDRQRARPLDHGHRHDARTGHRARCARGKNSGQRPRAEECDPQGARGNIAVSSTGWIRRRSRKPDPPASARKTTTGASGTSISCR